MLWLVTFTSDNAHRYHDHYDTIVSLYVRLDPAQQHHGSSSTIHTLLHLAVFSTAYAFQASPGNSITAHWERIPIGRQLLMFSMALQENNHSLLYYLVMYTSILVPMTTCTISFFLINDYRKVAITTLSHHALGTLSYVIHTQLSQSTDYTATCAHYRCTSHHPQLRIHHSN